MSARAIVEGALLIAALFLVKMVAKGIGIYPWTLKFRFGTTTGIYTTLLMATGLTFGTISAQFGLTHGYITQSQYTVLVTVVILSAVVPTLIAEKFFQPGIPSPGSTALVPVEDAAQEVK